MSTIADRIKEFEEQLEINHQAHKDIENVWREKWTNVVRDRIHSDVVELDADEIVLNVERLGFSDEERKKLAIELYIRDVIRVAMPRKSFSTTGWSERSGERFEENCKKARRSIAIQDMVFGSIYDDPSFYNQAIEQYNEMVLSRDWQLISDRRDELYKDLSQLKTQQSQLESIERQKSLARKRIVGTWLEIPPRHGEVTCYCLVTHATKQKVRLNPEWKHTVKDVDAEGKEIQRYETKDEFFARINSLKSDQYGSVQHMIAYKYGDWYKTENLVSFKEVD